MLSAGIEISVQCPKCDAAAPLNGPLLRVHCDKCQTAFELGPRFWFRILRDIYAEAGFRLEDGQGYNAEAFERYDVKVLYGRQQPSCGGCNEPLELARDGDVGLRPRLPRVRRGDAGDAAAGLARGGAHAAAYISKRRGPGGEGGGRQGGRGGSAIIGAGGVHVSAVWRLAPGRRPRPHVAV